MSQIAKEALELIVEIAHGRVRQQLDKQTTQYQMCVAAEEALQLLQESEIDKDYRLMLSDMRDEDIKSTIRRLEFELKQRAKYREFVAKHKTEE